MEVSDEEEDEVVDLCNAIIVKCWGIISETSPTFSCNVPTLQLHIILLNTVDHKMVSEECSTTTEPGSECDPECKPSCEPTSKPKSMTDCGKNFDGT